MYLQDMPYYKTSLQDKMKATYLASFDGCRTGSRCLLFCKRCSTLGVKIRFIASLRSKSVSQNLSHHAEGIMITMRQHDTCKTT